MPRLSFISSRMSTASQDGKCKSSINVRLAHVVSDAFKRAFEFAYLIISEFSV